MDRLLDIVSEKLIVRFKLKGNEDTDHIEGIRSLSSGIGYRFISKEVKDLFKTLLEEHVVSKLEDYCKRAVELGHDAIFTTNHGIQGDIFEATRLAH